MANKKNSVKNNDMSMKIMLAVALLAAFVGGYLVARAKYKPQIMELTKMVANKDESIQKMKSDANKVIMKDGEMWLVEDGIVKPMESDIMMPNGNKVTVEGKVVDPDGKETIMQNGDAMDMEGKMMPSGGVNIDTDTRSF